MNRETGETTGIRVVLDRMEVWARTSQRPVQLTDVEEWVAEAAHSYRATVRLDPWQAIGLMQRLRTRGVRCEEFAFSATSVGRLASTLHLLLRNHLLALPDDEELLDELAHVRLRETTPGVVRMDHDPDQHDDHAIALALASSKLVERARRRATRRSPGTPPRCSTTWGRSASRATARSSRGGSQSRDTGVRGHALHCPELPRSLRRSSVERGNALTKRPAGDGPFGLGR